MGSLAKDRYTCYTYDIIQQPTVLLGSEESAVSDVVVASPRAQVSAGVLQSTLKAELSRNTLSTVSGVDVLDEGNLEGGGGTLAGSNSRVGQEELPNLKSQLVSLLFQVGCKVNMCKILTRNQRLP